MKLSWSLHLLMAPQGALQTGPKVQCSAPEHGHYHLHAADKVEAWPGVRFACAATGPAMTQPDASRCAGGLKCGEEVTLICTAASPSGRLPLSWAARGSWEDEAEDGRKWGAAA